MPFSSNWLNLVKSSHEWLSGALDSPFMDLLPWLMMSWLGGSGRLLVGAGVGLGAGAGAEAGFGAAG